MGPLAQRLYQEFEDMKIAMKANDMPEPNFGPTRAMEEMRDSAFFVVDHDFFKKCVDIAEAFPVVEFTDKLPHRSIVIEVEGGPLALPTAYFLGPDLTLGDCIAIMAYQPATDDAGHALGHWRPKTPMVGVTKEIRDRIEGRGEKVSESDEFELVHTVASILNTMVELICEPTITNMHPLPRHTRRQAERLLGKGNLPEWVSKVSWNIGAKRSGGTSQDGSGSGKAYHLVRAHWRSYGDRKTPSGVERPGYSGFWVWIDSHHSGHPANGIVGHKYSPKMGDPANQVVAFLKASRQAPTNN
jgi:hypothetical protein